LLFVAFVLPVSGAAALLIGQQSARIALTERERAHIAFTTQAVAVVQSLRELRDRMEFDRDPGVDERENVAMALDALSDYSRANPASTDLSSRLALLRGEWDAVPGGADGAPEVDRALATASGLFDAVNEPSIRASEADAVTSELFDAYTTELPTIAERIDLAKLTLVRAIRESRSIVADRIAAAIATGQGRHAYDIVKNDVQSAQRGGLDASQLTGHVATIGTDYDAFIDLSQRTKLRSENPVAAAQQMRAAGDRIVADVFETDAAFAATIDRLLAERELGEKRMLVLMRTEAILGVLVGLFIVVLISRTIRDRDRRELDRAQTEAERLAGELERQRMFEDLAVTEAHFRAVFDRSSIGVAILDHDGNVLRSNRALQDMLETVDGKKIGADHPSFASLLAGEIESFTTELESGSENGHAWEVTLSLVRDDDGAARFAISMLKDITERKRIDDRLRHDASHDSLSGLPNRAYFCERLREAFFGDRPPEGIPAVLFVDLDEFKFVNDSLGHAVGDSVLVETGQRLRANTTTGDCIARFGGDEFAVLLDGRRTREDLEETVQRIGRSLAEPHTVDGREIFVTASIGVALVHGSYRTVEEILRDADTAMYYAKSTGRARSAVFDASMHDHASRRLDIATQLRRALEREQFYLAYQPVVSLATGAIESCEVLLRWENPDLGLVSPSEFIPIAEELGLIVPIGRYVLDRACKQFAEWKEQGIRHPARLSVNASVREIVQTDFVEAVEDAIARYKMKPGELILEVTETAILSSGKFSHGALDRLKAAGVGLAIDDFGTGYSSLRYLQQFPFDALKIDRSFISGADGRLASEPIVTMLLTLARSCGVGVIAEGVETPSQAARLRALGCTSAQGYLYGRPCRAAALPELFRSEENFAS